MSTSGHHSTGPAPVERANSQNAQDGRAAIVIVNYNGIDTVEACLNSVLRETNRAARVLVVDNASTDGSRQLLEGRAESDRRFELHLEETNRGYAAAINIALDVVSSEYLAILNMDTTVTSGWLEPMLEYLDENSGVAAVNPLLALTGGERVNAVGQDIHVSGLGVGRHLGQRCSEIEPEPVSVAGLQGAALVIRRQTLVALGGMNASGFLYHEDVNLSWLLRLTGWDLVCVPQSMVEHCYQLTMDPNKLHLLERNRLALLCTYPRFSTLVALSPWLIATELMVWIYSALRGAASVSGKLSSYRWIAKRSSELRHRRRWAQQQRTVSDWAIVRRLRFRYDWQQFLVLARQRSQAPPEASSASTDSAEIRSA